MKYYLGQFVDRNLDCNQQKLKETDSNRQHWTKMDRNGQQQTETNRNGQFSQVQPILAIFSQV